MSVVQDNPTWPIKDSEKGNYRLLVREVDFKEEDGQRMVRVKGYESVEDVVNVKSTYKFLKNITDMRKMNLFKIEL